MVSTVFIHSKLSLEYYSYAARYAAVMLMKTSVEDPSPWTRLTGRSGGIDSLKGLGQRCFTQVPREVRGKDDPSNKKGQLGTC
jgi:hypothetical protein